MKARIVMVAALGRDRVIGKEGDLPWRLPDDLKHFKALTVGKPVVMGRKTFDSMGKPLPGRSNIVMSRSARAIEGCTVVQNVDAAIEAAGEVEEISIIGGGGIYEAFLSRADVLELTLVNADVEGDAFFPEYEARFREVDRREHPADERHAYAFAFTRWVPR